MDIDKIEKPSVLRQMVRGCRDLPHVGGHPGAEYLLMFISLGAFAGANGGLVGVLGSAAVMALFVAPLYLYGAYDRANLSDRLEAESATQPTKEKA
jgi:hypothetical protein